VLPAQSTFERIALNRVTFGARDVDVQEAQRIGWSAWVEQQLDPPQGDEPALAQYINAQTMHIAYPAYANDAPMYSWPAVNEDRPLRYLQLTNAQLWSKSREVFRDYHEKIRPFYELVSATYIRNAHSRYQLREFMADFWLNHFSVYHDKDEQIRNGLIAYDRDVIRPNVFGNFRMMLEAVATSVAMLRYLDNAGSEAARPNENYARELMELHTMGRSAYLGKVSTDADLSARGFTDDDIIQASRAFSGWTLTQGQNNLGTYNPAGRPDTGEFVFNPGQHNRNAGRCLGFDLATVHDGALAQGRKVLDLVAGHPATAPFVCAKICRRIFGDDPPPDVLARAVAAWNANFDSPQQIKRVLQAILLIGLEIGEGPPVKARRPHERNIALLRVTDAVVKANETWSRHLQFVSDVPFTWRSPDGRPDTNGFWLTPQMNVEIWNALRLLNDPSITAMDILAQTPRDALGSAALFVEYWVDRLIGYSLGAEAMAALTREAAGLMSTLRGNTQDLAAALFQRVIAAIATTPEFVNR
jgi:uncharacterized protein (DUF1800 family)